MCWLQRGKFTSRCQVNAEYEGEYKFVRISRTGVEAKIPFSQIPQRIGLKRRAPGTLTTPD